MRKRGNYIIVLLAGLLLMAGQQAWAQQPVEVHKLSADDISEEGIIYLSDVWLFQPGDDHRWAAPALVDTSWQRVSTYLGPSELPFIDWNGLGWFRIHIQVDSTLVDYPLAVVIQQHNGASELYLDGTEIARLGRVGPQGSDYKPERNFQPVPLVLSDTTRHVLAVRYANHDANYFNSFNDLGFTSGFRFMLASFNTVTAAVDLEEETEVAVLPVFFIGGLLAFTVIHLLLYLFYPAGKRNLHFAIFTGGLVILIYALYINDVTSSPLKALQYYRFSRIFWILTVLLALRFTYSLVRHTIPLQFWGFLVIAGLLCVTSWYTTNNLLFLQELFVMLTLLEIIRVLLFSFFREQRGIGVVAVGVFFFVGSIFYKILVDLNFVNGEPVVGSIYGSAAMIFAMSIYLSRDFAQTNRQLEEKLREVKHLSERSLAQERMNQKRELERKLLAAENDRKSRELEEARRLQLSMLPKKIPGTPCWDIAVFMETAQEVGGDYYDFSDSNPDGLTIALGDATGHGMKAGIMVAAVKSYFHTLADGTDLLEILRQTSIGIRNMNLKMMYMGFQVLRCHDTRVTLASAGMPPLLWYQRQTGKVQEIRLRGLPLGTKAKYPYETREFTVAPGDVLMLMSDGLPELFDGERRQLGQQRLMDHLAEFGDHSASDIISRFTMLIEQWSAGGHQEDDITMMVMKVKE